MSFAEVEKHRILQRASEPLREMEQERRRQLKEAGGLEPEKLPILVRLPPWRERLSALLQRKPAPRTSSGVT